MVKRNKSPELAEDARYFTVYQPYPINANWILEEEQKKCSMWVAECIGLNYLWAIHYKPKARGMILLEVSKAFTDHGRLLGEHRWGDILKDPDEIEKKSVTQVFHCFYSKLRECQKDGWKAIPIQNDWFKGWMPGQGYIKRPYPTPHRCPVPAEDITNKRLCRPLPSPANIPPPPRAQQKVVGSSKWVVEKRIDAPPAPSATSNAWVKKAPSLDTYNLTQDMRGTKSPSPSVKSPQSAGPLTDSTATTTSASGSKPVPPAKNIRAKPVPLNAFISGETKTGKGGWGKLPASTKFAVNDPVPKGPVNAWSKKLNIPPSEKSPKISSSPSPYEMDYSAWTLPSPPEPSPPTFQLQSHAARLGESSRISEEPPPPKPNKGGGKGRGKGKQPAWKRNAQQPDSEEKPTEELEPVYSLADFANRKPPTRAEVDATLEPWERGKVDYAKLGVVDAEPKPFKYPAIGTSWGHLPINNTDKSESKDWADDILEGETLEGEWIEGKGKGAGPNEEPPNSESNLREEGYDDGGEYGEHDEYRYDYQPKSQSTERDGEPTTSSTTDWVQVGSRPAEGVRGPNDWGVADVVIPAAHIQEWERILEESLRPKRPQVEELICPTHNIACKKGICRDMAKLVRERDMAQRMQARGRGRGRLNGGRGQGRGDTRRPRGSRNAKELPDDEGVTYNRTRRAGNEKNKPKSSIGVMRGFQVEDGTVAAASVDGTAASEVGTAGDDGDDTANSDGGHLD